MVNLYLSVKSEAVAFHIFQIYLKKAKIEGVFKFLKVHLGWDSFQVREFKVIQNLIVFAYFSAGYFYEIEDDLIQNEWMRQVCVLGGGKGKITKVFFSQRNDQVSTISGNQTVYGR